MRILKKNITNLFGKNGEEWLISLPKVVKKLAQQWSLAHIKPVNNMSWNYVALAFQENSLPIVLKISCDKQIIQDEYKALRHFDGHGSIKVLAINWQYNALLLQQAIPGHCLKELHPQKLAETIKIYSAVVQVLATPKIYDNSTAHVSQWCNAVDRITDSRIEKFFVDKAKQLRSALLNTAQPEYLCHGDLHLENILQHGSHWLAIDPKGIIGDTAFEAAAFALLSPDELKDSQQVTSKLIDRVEKLSITLGIDFNRLLAWIFLRTIISAQWFIEDNGEPSESLDERLTLAKHVYPILRSSH
ncbi:MAG: hypothetical protein O7C59_05525 [Rickettsia endosymbiont of Ixodes persulcatus]|nr:hypothetical protein [Rickettsia endosymbiont of Ixodes persulcatus]